MLTSSKSPSSKILRSRTTTTRTKKCVHNWEYFASWSKLANNALRYHSGAGIFRSRRKRSFFSEQSRISRHLVGARGRFSRHPVSRQRISLIGACITISILPSAPFTVSHSSTPIPAPARQLFPQGNRRTGWKMSRDGSLDAKSCGMVVAFSNGRPSLPVLGTERCHKRFVKFSIKPSLFSFFPAANLGIGFPHLWDSFV